MTWLLFFSLLMLIDSIFLMRRLLPKFFLIFQMNIILIFQILNKTCKQYYTNVSQFDDLFVSLSIRDQLCLIAVLSHPSGTSSGWLKIIPRAWPFKVQNLLLDCLWLGITIFPFSTLHFSSSYPKHFTTKGTKSALTFSTAAYQILLILDHLSSCSSYLQQLQQPP